MDCVSNRVCRIGSFLASNWNCFKRVSLTGMFDSTEWTWWIKLFFSKFRFGMVQLDLLRLSKTSMFLPGKYWSSKSYFWRRTKNAWMWGGQETIYLLKIGFNCLWLLIMINLRPYKYSWKHSSLKTIERVSFSICS